MFLCSSAIARTFVSCTHCGRSESSIFRRNHRADTNDSSRLHHFGRNNIARAKNVTLVSCSAYPAHSLLLMPLHQVNHIPVVVLPGLTPEGTRKRSHINRSIQNVVSLVFS